MQALPIAILLVALQLPHSYQQQEPPTVHVATGQQLADAVADWGQAGGDMTIQVDSWYLSLENVTIRQLQPIPGQPAPFSSGKLRLVGQWDGKDNRTIINTAMRQLTPPLSGATVSVDNLVAFNNCEDYVTFASPQGPTLVRASNLGLFPLSFFYQSVTYSNCRSFVRHPQLATQTYLVSLFRAALFPVKSLVAPLLTTLPSIKANVTVVTSSLAAVSTYVSDQIAGYNVEVRSLSSKNDPLLQQLRLRGLIMAPQFCNGTLLPSELAAARFDPLTPAWLADNTGEFMAALQEAVAFTANSARKDSDWIPVPEVFVAGNATFPATVQLGPLRWPLLLMGPFNDAPGSAVTAVLDLQQGIDTIRLGPTGKLLIQQLTVTGLGLRTLGPSSEVVSALPMAAVSPAPSSNPQTDGPYVWMHNVTLMLPANDYLALSSLALASTSGSIRDCVGSDVRALADQLQGGIRSMSVAGVDVANRWLVLSSFVGWGLNATSLRVVPETPLAPLNGCGGSSQEKRCGRLSCGQLAGLLVGLLGGVCLLVAAAVFVMVKHKRQAARKGLPVEPGSVTKDLPSDQPPSGDPYKKSLMQAFLGEQLSYFVPAANSASQLASSSNSFDPAPSSEHSYQARHQIELKAMLLNSEADKVAITGTIGKGSSGVVFSGQWRGLKVALKTCVFEELPGEKPDSSNSRAVNEAAISASLSHPNIVATYRYDIKPITTAVNPEEQDKLEVVMGPEFKSSKQQPQAYKLYLVQEFCDFNLTFILTHRMLHHKETRAVDWYSLLRLLRDIATGLDYLHQNNIVHGDLKPCNILLKWHPVHRTRLVAKLADFGLSNHLQGDATHVSNFQAGTPFYVAPEVARLGRNSPASDVYALGVIMWECASGCDLYIQSSDGQTKLNPIYPGFPDHIQPDASYIKLLNRCIASDHRQRPFTSGIVSKLQVMIGDD